MKAVFESRPASGYDDQPELRYHFPRRGHYLRAALGAVGDWIVYYEPRREGGRQAYVAAAQVHSVDPDPKRPDHAYARVENFIEFDAPVAFDAGSWEESLRAIDRRSLGSSMQGRAMRPLTEPDFAAIVAAGLGSTLRGAELKSQGVEGVGETERPFDLELPGREQSRRIEQMLLNRKVRDASFRRQVCAAYDDRCAVTGLKIINGGGRSEVQAAHIWSVADGGPDVVTNGLALSGTVHWLFDRHLISLTDDCRLLVSHNRVPAELRGLFVNQMERIYLPRDRRLQPNPRYTSRHRERFLAS